MCDAFPCPTKNLSARYNKAADLYSLHNTGYSKKLLLIYFTIYIILYLENKERSEPNAVKAIITQFPKIHIS